MRGKWFLVSTFSFQVTLTFDLLSSNLRHNSQVYKE